MLTQQAIIDFCNQYDYDIRKSGNGRWIDQKCAADVVTVVADCIYNYALQDEMEFLLRLKYGTMTIRLKMLKPFSRSPV